MKNAVIFFTIILTLHTSIAEARPDKIWTSKKTGKVSDYPCLMARGYCSAEEMETDLKVKCLEAGYPVCETILRSDKDSGWGSNIFCGGWRENRCIVQVKGSSEL